MRPIPKKMLASMLLDRFYDRCSLHGQHDHLCAGRITLEHAIIYASRQLSEPWAIIPLCERGHAVNSFQDAGTMNKEMNMWVALNRATDAQLRSISKAIDYRRERDRLNDKYGYYIPSYFNPKERSEALKLKV